MAPDPVQKRLDSLRLAKLSAESERDKWRRRYRATRYRLRIARIALHAHVETIRLKAHKHANHHLKAKIRIRELVARLEEMEKDNNHLQSTIDTMKGEIICPKCGNSKPFEDFPLNPQKGLGRDLHRCKVCEYQRTKSYTYDRRAARLE